MVKQQQYHSSKHRRAAAYREAGHAVVAWDCGILLEPLSIRSRRRRARQNVWNAPLGSIDPDWIRRARPDMLIERLAMICLAGPIAEQRFSPGAPSEPASRQRKQDAEALLKFLYQSKEQRSQKRRRLEAKVEQFLSRSKNREITERLAEALFKHGTLSGDKARQIIEKTK
ncbi:MAG: hypothetical protein GTO42_01485 [Candidatus Latescibacteria bacterium]|nr:hypothetical protein [Candidatus Latescibacterota bacterium]NIO27202.1 hypothetical protein [Candidatus Latescibacterota bacterium]NIO54726.1 hypothetical protein [Candidatus Latescibacterota bacterium]NIT00809.1 hypothetical protein [Candidatus Latescibacterota bacterium]NIT37732.1 hypothetical protein [Candidatus Latescibacterota bacterium]